MRWFEDIVADAGPAGLRRAGLSAHEIISMHGKSVIERMRVVGADRMPDLYAAAAGVENLDGRLRWKIRQAFETHLSALEFDELTGPVDPLGAVDGVWP
jgi:hypothetical protein